MRDFFFDTFLTSPGFDSDINEKEFVYMPILTPKHHILFLTTLKSEFIKEKLHVTLC